LGILFSTMDMEDFAPANDAIFGNFMEKSKVLSL
jgi:hypothetical protein